MKKVQNNILANYVRKHSAGAMLASLLLLTLLNITLAFLGELTNLSSSYTLFDALRYMFWRTPNDMYDFLPMAALVGAVVGLGSLASNSELTVMRAAGVNITTIVKWVVQSAGVLVVISYVLTQFVLPVSNEYAVRYEAVANKNVSIKGFWNYSVNPSNPELNQVIHVEYADQNGELGKVNVWNIDKDSNITSLLQAKSGSYQNNQQWLLHDVDNLDIDTFHKNDFEKEVEQFGNSVYSLKKSVVVNLPLNPKYIYYMTREAEDLSITDLYTYNNFLAVHGKSSAKHKLAFWQKILTPIAFLSLVVIACSFVFGSMREQSMGLRIVIAILCGVAFRYVQEFSSYMSLIYDISPLWFVLTPIVISGCIGAWLLHKRR